ncbi:MAG: hypothetical protein OXJ64_18170, partial [Boseongicola sp.]|nr:hypothetical protein [Boseongicola sp.]
MRAGGRTDSGQEEWHHQVLAGRRRALLALHRAARVEGSFCGGVRELEASLDALRALEHVSLLAVPVEIALHEPCKVRLHCADLVANLVPFQPGVLRVFPECLEVLKAKLARDDLGHRAPRFGVHDR